jgi:hypothetical protein
MSATSPIGAHARVEVVMSRYRYADQPEPSETTYVHLPIGDDTVQCECLWAEPLGGDHYRLLNVVCWSQEYGLHDTVLAVAVGTDPVPEIVAMVERRTLVRFEFELPDGEVPDAAFDLGAAVCRVDGSIYVSNAPDRDVAASFQSYLERHAAWFSRLVPRAQRCDRTPAFRTHHILIRAGELESV